MFGILLLSHGKMAEGLLDSAKLFFGEIEKIKALCLLESDAVEEFDKKIIEALEELDEGTGVITLCDLYGGSPANRCVYVIRAGHKMRVVTGMNLAMLIELLGMRLSIESAEDIDLIHLIEAATESIVSLNEAIAATENPDDEEEFF